MVPTNKLLIPAVASAALLLAACGSSSSPSTTSASNGGSSTAASQPASSQAASIAIGTTSGSAGTYLTGSSGRALYIWVADSNGKSACSGACATAWPPVTATSTPAVSGGASAGDITLISRSDGSKQVAYKGRPLYYYAGDPSSGTTNGQGSSQFGAKWWLISPAGMQVVASASSSTGSSSSSGSSSGTTSTSSKSGGWG
jgi:predicted lipoprotein with Yx(FWY)xxD motif